MTDSSRQSQRRDFILAVGAIVCIAIGAAATYVIVHATRRKAQTPIVVREGQPLLSAGGRHAEQTVAVPKAPEDNNGEYVPLTFTMLSSFYYELPEPGVAARRDPIPAPIKAFDGKRVAIQGFMVPVDLKNGKTTRFLLVRDQSICCNFGAAPRMNELMSVRMSGAKATRVVLYQPLTVFGVLSVGELIENGEVQSVYRLEADDVAGPLDL